MARTTSDFGAIGRGLLLAGFAFWAIVGIVLLVTTLGVIIWLAFGLVAVLVLYYTGVRFDSWASGRRGGSGGGR
jgi:hypothetical protein